MALLSLRDVSLAFGGPMLLDGASLLVEKGERICLIGRNGAGKSSLMRLVHGELPPDRGIITRERGVRTALLPQEVPADIAGTVYEIVASGQARNATETEGARDLDRQVRILLAATQLDESAPFSRLSAGMKRRVLLARSLAGDPDVLLLDEPTNHLDISAIVWMEDFLLRFAQTMIFVSHDRAFLDRVSTRIVELDRGSLFSFSGSYEDYRSCKEGMLENEAVRNGQFDRRLRREEAWLRRGVRARRTRNEGRVRALLKMREQVQRRRTRSGHVRLTMQGAETSGRLVLEALNITFSYEGDPIVGDFSAAIMRGEKVGIVGPNGCGKTTLLRLLLGEIVPQAGFVRYGTRLQTAYFDQLRARLDETRTLQENVADFGDTVFVNGRPRNVLGYLQDFLFSPSQARSPISALSGGERNRLLLAKLFAHPSNLLVLDEPTNDLDPETLELLETMLVEYGGTVLIVSHDRAFLNNVVSSLLVFEGRGRVQEYVGGYDDWLRRQQPVAAEVRPGAQPKKARSRPTPAGPRKLTFKEELELEQLPERIEQMEDRRQTLLDTLADPSFYKRPGEEIARHKACLEELQREMHEAYARWEALEEAALKSRAEV